MASSGIDTAANDATNRLQTIFTRQFLLQRREATSIGCQFRKKNQNNIVKNTEKTPHGRPFVTQSESRLPLYRQGTAYRRRTIDQEKNVWCSEIERRAVVLFADGVGEKSSVRAVSRITQIIHFSCRLEIKLV